MYYYEVQVSGRSYHSKKPLTYSYQELLNDGAIVSVPVRSKQLKGFVVSKVKKPTYQTKEIIAVSDAPALSKIARELYEWMLEYYPSTDSSALQLFMPSSIPKKTSDEKFSKPTASTNQIDQPLRKQQKEALQALLRTQKSAILHGETGSGKTRVYAAVVRAAYENGKSSLVLTPEIGLTSQLARQLDEQLHSSVIVLHSQLTLKEKRQRWIKIATSKVPLIIVGTRSALFAPYQSLNEIIIDEAHEDAYKESQSPHYDATIVAGKLAKLHGARLLLGSATPSITQYNHFTKKNLPIIPMKAPSTTNVECHIVDSSDRANFSRSQHLSTQLLDAMSLAISHGEQVLLFLNRRGSARLVLCQSCGWEDLCPNCDIPLTFHADQHEMRCHTCGHHAAPPLKCPSCASSDIYFKQLGTKSLVTHVQKLFPDTRVARFDTDLVKSERLEARYPDVHSGKLQILVGTQMLGKGLDLPKLSVVGVVQADSSLLIPDFTAHEKTYQQIHQIIGRVGRGHRDGAVFLQTYNPKSEVLHHALEGDYHSFYASELSSRKTFLYPPYSFLLSITCQAKTDKTAQQNIDNVVKIIKSLKITATIVGPSPAFKQKTHGNYHWHVLVKSKDRSHLLRVVDALPTTARYVLDPINLL